MKKGFTLIELLAVIVILAIIALIATPIVLNIINDTKESAVLRSADFYVDAVQNKIMQENMKLGGKLNTEQCIVNTDGNITCDGTDLEIEVNGEKPTGGNITFDKGLVTSINLTYGDKVVSTDINGQLVLGDKIRICKLISGNANEIGSKYQCKVKYNMEIGFEDGYYFYLLAIEDDGTVNLIMDRNIYYDEVNDIGKIATEENNGIIAWNSDASSNAFGPVTALNYLHNATKDWNNVPNMIMNYEDENIDEVKNEKGSRGYGKIVTTNNTTQITERDGITITGTYENLKARMPMYKELIGDKKCNTNGGSCPLWLVNYLTNSSSVVGSKLQNINGINGYWILSSYEYSDQPGSNGVSFSNMLAPGYAWGISYSGGRAYSNASGNNFGVRPVITLKL